MTNLESIGIRRRVSLTSVLVGIIAATGLAACGGRESGANAGDSAAGTAAAAGASTGAHAGMPGMQGMGGQMMEQMQSHLRMMETANADSMKAMLPMHRQMVGNMLSEMNRQMRDMKMTADARWTALADSVRQDLVRLPQLGAAELRTFMPEHRGRLVRLMEVHRTMMRGMKV